MKYVLLLIGVFGLFILGYLLEPTLREIAMREPKPPEPEVAVAKQPEPQSKPKTEPAPEGEPDLASESEPEAVIDEQPKVAGTKDDEIRQIMEQSIQQAEIKQFTISQVTEWKTFGEEENEGVSYLFGLIDYREENSIFGERIFEAKALIRDGKVEKWIWTSNGMRIP